MTTEINQLMGEIIENPEGQVKDIEQLLTGLLNALIKEHSPKAPTPTEGEAK
jgi:hypothetical protein